MPRVHPLTPSMNAGELSPRLAARTDFAKYPAGLETSVNGVLLSEGGFMRRAGTRYIAAEKSAAVKGRLKRFQFSTTQAYILEFGEQVIRFYRHQGQIVVADTTAAVANGDFPTGIASWDDRSTGGAGNQISHDATNLRLTLETSGVAADDIGWAEQAITTGSTGTEHVIKFRVLGAPGDKVEFQVGTATLGAQTLAATEMQVGWHCVAFTPTTSPFYIQFRNLGINRDKDVQIDDVAMIDDAAVEITTPYTEAQLFDIEGPQTADVLYLYHPSHPTYKLERGGHTTWSLVEVPWVDGPYLDLNATTTTLLPSAATGLGINLTLSSIVGVNDGRGWQSTDIGRLVRYKKTSAFGYAVITSITSTTVAVADVREDFEATPTAKTTFHLGAWSGTTGYPLSGTFFEQRLVSAGTTKQPQTFWMSQTADFENMTPDDLSGTVGDDDAFDFTISADNVDAIRWMTGVANTLAIGTVGGEWVPSSVGAVLTPTDVTVRRQTTHGSAAIQPVRVDNVVLFVQRAKRKLRELGFAFEVDGFQAPDMTRLSQHITYGGIIEMDFAEEPDSLLWAVRADGQLLSMTFRRDEDVVGWGRHIIGGSFGSGDAVVESVAVIPGDNGSGQTQDSTSRDEVWVTVKRTINGATARYVEMIERDFEDEHAAEDAYYVDSCITYDGASATVLTGLDHLEGATVGIWGDGSVRPDQVVASGSITLDAAASVAQIGLRYQHTIKSLKLEGGNPAGTAVGKIKRIYGLTFVVLNSHTIKYGPTTSGLTEEDFRVVSDAMDAGVPLFTGEHFVQFDGPWETDARIIVQSDDPAPFTLLALAPETDIKGLK